MEKGNLFAVLLFVALFVLFSGAFVVYGGDFSLREIFGGVFPGEGEPLLSPLSACGTISAPGVYTLQNDVSSAGTCFTINNDNITLDGAGYLVNYSQSAVGFGVDNSLGYDNVTIKNLVIEQGSSSFFSSGIYFNFADYGLIENNTITIFGTEYSYGVYLHGGSNVTVTLNNIVTYEKASGIYLESGSVSSKLISNNITLLKDAASIVQSFCGISVLSSKESEILNNQITSFSFSGVCLSGNSDLNTVTNNLIDSKNSSGIVIGDILNSLSSDNNNFTGNTVVDNGQLQLYLGEGISGTYLIDQPILNYSFAGAGGIVNFKNTTAGEIRFLEAINGSGESLSNDVQIGNNSVVVNSSQTGLNKSAEISLYGLPSFTNPVILRDGVACPVGVCANLTALDIPNVRFNVTSWTNYSIGEKSFEVTGCGVLGTAGGVYTQTANIIPTVGPCIDINNENITFNGNGFWISNKTLAGTGIYSNQKNTSIVNANVSMSSSAGGYGIKLWFGADNSYIYNNTLNGQFNGLYAFGVSGAEFIGNIANNNGNNGIFFISSLNNDLTDNTVNNNNNNGIFLSSDSNSNRLQNNVANDNNNNGIYVESSSNNFLRNNTIITSKADSGGIKLYSNSDFNVVINNTINVTQGDSINILPYLFFSTYPKNNNFTSNTLTDNGQIQFLMGEGINGTYLIDQPILNYSFAGAGGIVNFKNTTAGEIRFLEAINGSGESLSNDVRIVNNSVTVESGLNAGLNKSAEISLYGLPTDIIDPMILRDGVACPIGICTNLTSLNAGIVVFNVSYWTSYEIGGTFHQSLPSNQPGGTFHQLPPSNQPGDDGGSPSSGSGGGISSSGSSDSSQECMPDWRCEDWSVCVNGSQSTVCADVNNCGVNDGKPAEMQECEATVWTEITDVVEDDGVPFVRELLGRRSVVAVVAVVISVVILIVAGVALLHERRKRIGEKGMVFVKGPKVGRRSLR